MEQELWPRKVALEALAGFIYPDGCISLRMCNMKIIPLLVLLASAGWLGAVALRTEGQSYTAEVLEVPHQLSGGAPAGFTDLAITMDGMCGPCCERTLFDKARSVEGVVAVAVSYADGTVIVRLPEAQGAQSVLEALTTDQHTPTL